jgi:uncharacterized protein DUF4082/N,N-dimethylformamidase beta subunit-like protein/Big-like domain-containing protein
VFMSVGHDEYWSGTQRTNVENARNAGVHLAFFSGNIMFWKTRWENSIGGASTPYRTLVCYKETHADAKIDPLPNVWTGTWRDPRFSPPNDGGRPENALTGTIFKVNDPAEDDIKVPEALGKYRFWRNTTVATQSPGNTAIVGTGTVGYEWDEDLSNGFRPSGLIRLSTNTVNVPSYLQDFGSTYGSGTATHSLTLYRHSSGALVFSAATIRWSWGLDNNHDQSEAATIPPPDTRMRQATVNLLADMNVQPATLQPGLIQTTSSNDTLLPSSTITSPAPGAVVAPGTSVNLTGTASDASGGVVAGVNVSVDGGITWNRATGTGTWSYSWTPTSSGSATILSIAVDDSGNAQNPPTQITVTVGGAPRTCPCSVWGSGAMPDNPTENDATPVELGMKFRSDSNGQITGVRFYKGDATNGGTHIGHLWTSTGTLLGSVTFSGETASGWQQALFQTPITITANTTYVVSYFAPQGMYASDANYFASSGVDNAPLHALSNAAGGGNGVYRYGSPGGFPNDTSVSTNYWVDVVFTSAGPSPDTTPPTVVSFTPAAGAGGVSISANVKVTFSEAMNAATVNDATVELRGPLNLLIPAAVSYNAASRTVTLDPTLVLVPLTTYTARVKGGNTDPRVKDLAGNALVNDVTWSFTTALLSLGTPTATTPDNSIENDASAAEFGLKFRSDGAGSIRSATPTATRTSTPFPIRRSEYPSLDGSTAESSFKVDSCNTTTPVTFALGQKGLTSLNVNGFEAIGDPNYQGEFGNVTADFRRADGSVYSVYAGSAQSTQLEASSSIVTHRFSWGDVSIRYSRPCGNQIRFDLDVLNRSADSLTKLSAFLMILDFPEIPVGTNWSGIFPLINFPRLADPARGLPAIRINYGNYGAITLANETDPKISTMFGNFINFNSDRRFSLATSYSENIAPGTHATYSGSIRAGLPSAGLADLAPDVIQRYAAELPQQAWLDRRPIGRVFLANGPSSAGGNSPQNPRGWINLPGGTDIRTPEGLAAFRQMMLSKADDIIRNLHDMNAQGVIVWDIEGQEYPHMTSYVGDPTKMDQLAPEMNYMGPGDALVVADEFFNRIKSAGFAVGVCLRPQRFACANGSCEQLDTDNPEDLIAAKADYAANRWGASIFYVDSNVHPVYGWPIPGRRLITRALAMHPQSLFIGEWVDQSYSGIGAPYYATAYDGVTATTNDSRIVYPGGFGAIVPGDKPNGSPMNELSLEYLQGLKNGDVYMPNIWFQNGEFALVKSITQLGGSRPSITMNGPVEGQITPAAAGILLDVTATSPDRSITKVEFFTAGLKIGEVANGPFRLLWKTPSLGKHSLTARVTDSNGMQAVSAPVEIEVR